MAELASQDRLQPSLLDRLTDHARFRERITLVVDPAAAIDRDHLMRWLEAQDWIVVGPAPDGPQDQAQELVLESRPGSRAIARVLERPPPGAGEGAPALETVVTVRRRERIANTSESRQERVISARQLREVVVRDLAWLLNTGHLEAVESLQGYPRARASVLNYGIPDLAGLTESSANLEDIAADITRAIECFEPRLRNVRVAPAAGADNSRPNAVQFTIEADLWNQPLPEHLHLFTELDLESADVRVRDSGAGG